MYDYIHYVGKVLPNNCSMTYSAPVYTAMDVQAYSGYGLYKVSMNFPRDTKQVPVLFVPGNLGSYKQARSLSRHLFDVKSGDLFDVYAIDFKEEASAFSGNILDRQSYFVNICVKRILQKYSRLKSPPTSVIIVAHSMGGMVARGAMVQSNYNFDSIQTIFTLSTPQRFAPYPLDQNMILYYKKVNEFWIDGTKKPIRNKESATYFRNHVQLTAREIMENIIVVSIGGGFKDIQVFPQNNDIAGYIEPKNGLAFETLELPHVTLSVDHLCILWCKQVMAALRQAITAVVLKSNVGVHKHLFRPIVDVNERMLSIHHVLRRNATAFASEQWVKNDGYVWLERAPHLMDYCLRWIAMFIGFQTMVWMNQSSEKNVENAFPTMDDSNVALFHVIAIGCSALRLLVYKSRVLLGVVLFIICLYKLDLATNIQLDVLDKFRWGMDVHEEMIRWFASFGIVHGLFGIIFATQYITSSIRKVFVQISRKQWAFVVFIVLTIAYCFELVYTTLLGYGCMVIGTLIALHIIGHSPRFRKVYVDFGLLLVTFFIALASLISNSLQPAIWVLYLLLFALSMILYCSILILPSHHTSRCNFLNSLLVLYVLSIPTWIGSLLDAKKHMNHTVDDHLLSTQPTIHIAFICSFIELYACAMSNHVLPLPYPLHIVRMNPFQPNVSPCDPESCTKCRKVNTISPSKKLLHRSPSIRMKQICQQCNRLAGTNEVCPYCNQLCLHCGGDANSKKLIALYEKTVKAPIQRHMDRFHFQMSIYFFILCVSYVFHEYDTKFPGLHTLSQIVVHVHLILLIAFGEPSIDVTIAATYSTAFENLEPFEYASISDT